MMSGIAGMNGDATCFLQLSKTTRLAASPRKIPMIHCYECSTVNDATTKDEPQATNLQVVSFFDSSKTSGSLTSARR